MGVLRFRTKESQLIYTACVHVWALFSRILPQVRFILAALPPSLVNNSSICLFAITSMPMIECVLVQVSAGLAVVSENELHGL